MAQVNFAPDARQKMFLNEGGAPLRISGQFDVMPASPTFEDHTLDSRVNEPSSSAHTKKESRPQQFMGQVQASDNFAQERQVSRGGRRNTRKNSRVG